jgi:hypothetical protein
MMMIEMTKVLSIAMHALDDLQVAGGDGGPG